MAGMSAEMAGRIRSFKLFSGFPAVRLKAKGWDSRTALGKDLSGTADVVRVQFLGRNCFSSEDLAPSKTCNRFDPRKLNLHHFCARVSDTIRYPGISRQHDRASSRFEQIRERQQSFAHHTRQWAANFVFSSVDLA